MKGKNRIVALNIISTLLLYMISFLSAPIFAALLGTEDYGDLSVFNTWVSVAAIIMTLHTTGTIANACVEFSEEEQPKYQSAAMSLSLIAFAFFSCVILAFLTPVSEVLKMEPVLIVMIVIAALGTFGVQFMNQKFTFEMKAGRNMAASVGLAVTNLAVSLIFVLSASEEQRLYGRAFAQVVSYSAFGIPFCVAILWKGRTFFEKRYWKLCLSLAAPVAFYGLTDLLLGHSDLVMLRSLAGSESAGIYGLAYQISTVIFTVFTALNTSWMAFFFNDMKANRRDVILCQSRNYLELYTVLACGFILLAPEVFRILSTQEYHSGAGLIVFMAASFYLNFLCTFPYNYECFHKKMHVISIVTVVSALVNIVLNYVLILRMDMLGAALATLISRVFQFAAHFCYSRFILGKKDYPFGVRVWGPYALGFVVTMALVIVLPDTWLPRWAFGAVLGTWELLRIRKRRALL